MTFAEYATKLTQLLGLQSPPVGVKFVRTGELPPENFTPPAKRIRFCQAVMEASWGKSLLVSASELACGPGPSSFGAPIKEKVYRGEVHSALGIFGSPEAAAKCLTTNPKMPAGSVASIAVAPLERFTFPVDTVIVRVNPEQAMWLCQTRSYEEGKHLVLEILTEQSVCAGMSVAPYIKSEIGVTFGCYGSRTYTDLKPEEMMVGIPGSILPKVVSILEKMGKPVTDSRSKKGFYEAYPEKKAA